LATNSVLLVECAIAARCRAGGSGNPKLEGAEFMKRILAILAVATAPLGGGAAQAAQQWPASIVGTWSATADLSVGQFTITSQSGGATCNQITGTIGSDTLLGFYCPGSGRFNFLRSNGGETYQAYSGNLTETVLGAPVMGGTFVDFVDNPMGEFSFFASPAN
jgi:hypothetical protein